MILVIRGRIAKIISERRTQEQVIAAKPTSDYYAKVTTAAITSERLITQGYAEIQNPAPLNLDHAERLYSPRQYPADSISRRVPSRKFVRVAFSHRHQQTTRRLWVIQQSVQCRRSGRSFDTRLHKATVIR